jgi:hypothetical protein
MRRIVMGIARVAVVAGAAGGTALVFRKVVSGRKRAKADPARWRYVTVNRTPEEVAPGGKLPAPLADLGDAIETSVRLAPGGRGTELGARLVGGEPSGKKATLKRLAGTDPRQDVRAALREAKQLIEVGEVLSGDKPGTSKSTLRAKPLELALQRAGREGVL